MASEPLHFGPGEDGSLRYAVAWRGDDGAVAVGNLVLDGSELVLRGSQHAYGSVERVHVPLADLVGVRIGRTDDDRVLGERSVVIALRSGAEIAVAPLGEAGAVFELADLVAELGARTAARRSAPVVVVLPLQPGTATRARELVAEGPPFDLSDVDVDRHEVFVTEHEVVFLFEGRRAREAVERLLRRPSVLREAVRWRECAAGRPRLGVETYGWQRAEP